MRMSDWFTTCFCPKRPSSDDTYIKITKKSYWVMSGLYICGSFKMFPQSLIYEKYKIIQSFNLRIPSKYSPCATTHFCLRL